MKEVRNDLNILKAQCGARVKDHILERIRRISVEANVSEIQQNDLLPLSHITLFLKKHIPKTYDEVLVAFRLSVDPQTLHADPEGGDDGPNPAVPRAVRSVVLFYLAFSPMRRRSGTPKTRLW